MPTTTADLVAAIRKNHPELAKLNDVEVEAFAGRIDPEYRDMFDRARGALPSQGLPLPKGKPPDPSTYEDNSLWERAKESGSSFIDNAIKDAPMVGGAVGGVIGGASGFLGGLGLGAAPGAVAGAALGATGGESLKQFINRMRGEPGTPKTYEDSINSMIREGAVNAAFEGGGQIAAKGLQVAAPAVYRAGTRTAGKLLEEFPTAIQDAINMRAPATAGGRRTAKAALDTAHDVTSGYLQETAQAGGRGADIEKDIIDPLMRDVGPKAASQADTGKPEGQQYLDKRVQQLRDRFRLPPPPPAPVPVPDIPTPPAYEAMQSQREQLGPQFNLAPSRVFSPTAGEVKAGVELPFDQASLAPQRIFNPPPEAAAEVVPPKVLDDLSLYPRSQDAKREAQDAAHAAWRSEEMGHPISSVEKETEKSIATSLKNYQESVDPRVAQSNQDTQRAIGVNRMLEQADRKSGSLAARLAAAGAFGVGAPIVAAQGHPLAAGALALAGGGASLLTSPEILTTAAVNMDRLAKPQLWTQGSRSLYYALKQALEEDQPPSQ